MPAGPDGNVEPWDLTDLDRMGSAGVSISGINDSVGVYRNFPTLGAWVSSSAMDSCHITERGPVTIFSGQGSLAILE